MAFKIVIVCSANICRSPAAMRLMSAALPEELERAVTIESAGVDASPGRDWCERSTAWVGDVSPDAAQLFSGHRSRRLTAAKVERADLILAADAEVRAAVVRMSPRARDRLFTLVEATALATAVRSVYSEQGQDQYPGVRLEPRPGRNGTSRMQWWVAEMAAARGLVPIARNGRVVHDPLDPHGERRGSHQETLSTINDCVTTLVDVMRFVNEA